jgi:hypothetical protein
MSVHPVAERSVYHIESDIWCSDTLRQGNSRTGEDDTFSGKSFRPDRDDIRLIGRCGGHLTAIIAARSRVRDVYASTSVTAHYRQHARQFDIERAEVLLPGIFADPLAIYQGKKESTLVFVEQFDEAYYLLVPLKCLPQELWLETLYIEEQRRFRRRPWVRKGMLYRREG